MSSKVISRLMVFFVGIPAVICLVWFNQMNHLALHVVVTLLAIGAADELFNMFRRRKDRPEKPVPAGETENKDEIPAPEETFESTTGYMRN